MPNKSKMADGRFYEKKPLNRHVRNRLTDFDEIWHGDSRSF